MSNNKRMAFGPVLPASAQDGDQFTLTTTGITYTYTNGMWTDGKVMPDEKPKKKKKTSTKKKE